MGQRRTLSQGMSVSSASGGGIDLPPKIVRGLGGEIMLVRVGLSRETISGLVACKKLLFCFQIDNNEVEVHSGDRRSFADVVCEGSAASLESFEFPLLRGSYLAGTSDEFPTLVSSSWPGVGDGSLSVGLCLWSSVADTGR